MYILILFKAFHPKSQGTWSHCNWIYIELIKNLPSIPINNNNNKLYKIEDNKIYYYFTSKMNIDYLYNPNNDNLLFNIINLENINVFIY